ncbi:MAG: RNase adapter RapZ [Deltaproteobacteria bacterium]|nr:RNase adapter RapZ [Deltaproteobacteria bacterium]
MKNLRVVIVTGLSGSGKSTALRALEDIGFFCVDNLPILLLEKFLEMQSGATSEISKVAIVMDLREKYFLENYLEVISRLKKRKFRIEILFLEAGDEELLHRFSETRRVHPVSEKGSILESIKVERLSLAPLREMADTVLDSSHYNVHKLKELVQQYYLAPAEGKKMTVHLMSFGYRFGLPLEADMVFDVRFLPNPYFVKDLKKYDGNDEKVEQYVMKWADTKRFVKRLLDMVDFLMPLFEKEGKSYLTIAIGCTGGKHRSVVILNQLAQHFAGKEYSVTINHRDIGRG